MNKQSKIVLFIILLLVVLTGLFPPWKYQNEVSYGDISLNVHGSSRHSFHLIFDPPNYTLFTLPIFTNQNGILDNQEATLLKNADSGYSVDLSRLAIIWSILGLIAACLLVIINIKTPKDDGLIE